MPPAVRELYFRVAEGSEGTDAPGGHAGGRAATRRTKRVLPAMDSGATEEGSEPKRPLRKLSWPGITVSPKGVVVGRRETCIHVRSGNSAPVFAWRSVGERASARVQTIEGRRDQGSRGRSPSRAAAFSPAAFSRTHPIFSLLRTAPVNSNKPGL